jgi:hypothetical protein
MVPALVGATCPLVGKPRSGHDLSGGFGIVATWRRDHTRLTERAHGMGTYLFERYTGEGAGRGAGPSLQEDVAKALTEIDWVDNFAIHADSHDDEVVGVDVAFDEEWPDIRTSNPNQVSEVFRRLGLRTIANPALGNRQAAADDPLSADLQADDEGLDLFEFEE